MYMNIKTFEVIIEKDQPTGYHARCPALPGCHSQGDTVEEAREHIAEAIYGYVESLSARNKFLSTETICESVLVERLAIPFKSADKLMIA